MYGEEKGKLTLREKQQKTSAGLIAKTEKRLAAKVGHLEILGKGGRGGKGKEGKGGEGRGNR